MARFIVLDASPLWLAVRAPGLPAADACRAWMTGLEATGAVVVVPEIADYEVRRKLIHQGATANLARLDALNGRADYRPLTTAAMRRAAGFWAQLRAAGLPTAGPDSLDADAVLAGQAATVGGPADLVIVATRNTSHLTRFPGLDAREWTTIA